MLSSVSEDDDSDILDHLADESKVFSDGVFSASRIFVGSYFCEDYLSWMTPKLRNYYYGQVERFGEGAKHFVEGLRMEHGVDSSVFEGTALTCYKLAASHGNFVAHCKYILLREKLLPEEPIDHPAEVIQWLQLGLNFIEDARVSFINQLLMFEMEDLLYLENILASAELPQP